jgi:nitroreductase
MSFKELMAERRSCREFKRDEVPDELLGDVLSVAQLTASWCNSQPWGVHLLRGPAKESFCFALREHVANHEEDESPDFELPAEAGVYRERQHELAGTYYASLGIERGDRAARTQAMLRNYLLYDAPVGLIVTSDRQQGTYGAVDCGAYVANLMNAAFDQGLGAVALGAIGIYAGKVRELLGISADRVVVCAVAIGYPDPARSVSSLRTCRAELEQVVTTVEAS